MWLMKQNRKQGWGNCILTLFIMGASVLLMGIFFDFYYDMNDDTMMREIMSGAYSGTPDGHNMQTLYPLGALIALCYRMCGSFPWYGAFLFLCQFGCFFLVGVRLCALADIFQGYGRAQTGNGSPGDIGGGIPWDNMKRGTGMGRRLVGKLCCLLVMALFQWGIWLTHMVNVQYTITCGMLVGAAVFLFLTIPERMFFGREYGKLPAEMFMVKSLPAFFLFLLAFHLRSEMALLTLPFLGLAGLFCWWEDRPVFGKKNLQKYGGLLLLLLVGMGFSVGADSIAYDGEWREFRQFFNDRTTIYDFYPEVLPEESTLPDMEMEKLGISAGSQILLKNYNFGLDERIDAWMFSDLAAYAKEHVGGERDWGAIFREKLLLYRYRSFHGGDAPYNLLVIFGYGINIIAIVILLREDMRELFAALIQLLMIFFVRSGLWMFILMRGRDPERITHPLYLVEFCLLAGIFLWRQCRAVTAFGCQPGGSVDATASADMAGAVIRHGGFAALQNIMSGASAVLLLLSVWGLWKDFPAVKADQARRQEINRESELIDAYCRAHPDTFYFEDVYSTVAFSAKLLECRDNTLANYDIAGGWMCKSPLYRKKLAAFGIEEAAGALTEGKACFIMSDEEESLRGLTWIEIPYAEHDLAVHVEAYDRIGENYGVYQVIPVSESGQFLWEPKRGR